MKASSVRALRRSRQSPEPVFDLERHAFYLFTQIFGRRNRDLTNKLKPFRITVPKWRVLAVLRERPNCTMNQMADFTTVDRTTLTRTLDQMEKSGLIERRSDQLDRRSVRLRLTRRGNETFNVIWPAVAEQSERSFKGVSGLELSGLLTVLHRMIRNLDPDYDSRNAIWKNGQADSAASKKALP